MIAYVTSIGERTRDLCVWALVRNGFDVVLLDDATSLAQKLKQIYRQIEDDFVRVDADVIVNQYFTPAMLETLTIPYIWWWQFQSFDWFQQTVGFGGVQFIRKEALPYLRDSVESVQNSERPETELSRIPEFYNPRRFESDTRLVGLNNYKNDIERVRAVKERRNQKGYDWELAKRLEAL